MSRDRGSDQVTEKATLVVARLQSVNKIPFYIKGALKFHCPALLVKGQYGGISIYHFSRKWRKQTNMGKRLIRKTIFFNKTGRTLSFASWQNFASIENMTFQDLKCFHGPRQLHCVHRKRL
jgi:hypothetical protein